MKTYKNRKTIDGKPLKAHSMFKSGTTFICLDCNTKQSLPEDFYYEGEIPKCFYCGSENLKLI